MKRKKLPKNKKGVFFSTDAIIALVIIIMSISVIYPIIKYSEKDSFIQQDIIVSLSALQVGEIDNAYVQSLISSGDITTADLNKSILEIIGKFYVNPATIDIAKQLAQEAISSIDTKENIGIWYGNELLASMSTKPEDSSDEVIVERQIISGIEEGKDITGYSARAFLTSGYQTKYFYFGGYVGEGNITARIDYIGEIKSAEMELAINNDFDVSINSNPIMSFSKSPSDFQPSSYSLPISQFSEGNNYIEISGNNLHISGGFIKITYDDGIEYTGIRKNYFPGVEGIINLYDGLYVPGQLNNMNIYIKYNNIHTTHLIIGNRTIYSGSTDGGDLEVNLDNAYLQSMLDYNDLSRNTVPVRFATENFTYLSEYTQPVDVYSVVDLSGSMNENIPELGMKLIELVTDANKAFIEIILNSSDNRVGLVGYNHHNRAKQEKYYHPLSNDSESLIDKIEDDWDDTGAGNCVCCGVLRAIQGHLEESDETKYKTMVVFSDAKANGRCDELGIVPDLNGDGTADSDEDHAIQAACNAYNNHNISVFTIGYGDADEPTMQAMAACGNGFYYYSDVSDLIDVYKTIAENIIQVAFYEQTAVVTGEFYSKLYPDSYTEINYEPETIPYGMMVTAEKQFTNNERGSFYVPPGANVTETRVVSYSGPRWTSIVKINNAVVYNLTKHGTKYIELGDPYALNLPTYLVEEDNLVELKTGISPENMTHGSEYNKIIYTIVRDIVSFSGIKFNADGCEWNLEFEDISPTTIGIPEGYSNGDRCYYNSTIHNPTDSVNGDNNDAITIAVYRLLESLDFDEDGQLDVQFTQQDLEIVQSEISGIPFPWETEIQVRKWY